MKLHPRKNFFLTHSVFNWDVGLFSFAVLANEFLCPPEKKRTQLLHTFLPHIPPKLLCNVVRVKGELNPKTDFSSFEHLVVVEQL